MNLILMGLPGAGKGTQAQKIVSDYKVVHISTGDMFREAMSEGTEVGLEAKKYIDKGELVPDEVTSDVVKERLSKNDVKENGYMLDGYPRTIAQADSLDEITSDLSQPIDAVINIDVPSDKLVERLSGRYICRNCGATYHKIYNPTKVDGVCDVCGGTEFYQRDDDKPETVKNRLKVNIEMNTPLIKYYDEKELLYSVDGDRDIDDVYKDIKKILDKF